MRALSLLVALTGCDAAFGLSRDDTPDAYVEPCPATYSAATGAAHKYRLVTTDAMWAEAAADCADDTQTHVTHLVVFEDLADLQALQVAYGSQWSFIRVHTGYARNIGAPPLDIASFQAVTEGGVAANLWGAGEPNNVGNIETTTSVSGNSLLADDNPVVARPYLCSCDGIPATRTFTLQ